MKSTFHYDSIAIRVSAASSHLIWLEEFFSPQMTIDDSNDFQFEVILEENSKEYSRVANLRTNAEAVDTIILDQIVIQCPSWFLSDGTRVVHDEPFDALYICDQKSDTIRILALQDARRIRTALMRVIRELIMGHERKQGGLFLHASAFEIDNQGVIIVGCKGAGKTTSLIYALHDKLTRYVSNDRVMVKMNGETVRMRGMPTFPTIRRDSLDFFPEIKTKIPIDGFAFRQHQNEISLTSDSRVTPWIQEKYLLNPLQFCQILQTDNSMGCPAKKLIFSRGGCDPGKIEFQPITQTRSLELIMDVLFGVGHLKKSSEVFYLPTDCKPATDINLKHQCEAFISNIDCYEGRIGLSKSSDNPDTSRYFDQLFG